MVVFHRKSGINWVDCRWTSPNSQTINILTFVIKCLRPLHDCITFCLSRIALMGTYYISLSTKKSGGFAHTPWIPLAPNFSQLSRLWADLRSCTLVRFCIIMYFYVFKFYLGQFISEFLKEYEALTLQLSWIITIFPILYLYNIYFLFYSISADPDRVKQQQQPSILEKIIINSENV